MTKEFNEEIFTSSYLPQLANFRSVISNQNHSTSLESTLQTRLAWVNQPAGQVKEGGRESGDRADGLMYRDGDY